MSTYTYEDSPDICCLNDEENTNIVGECYGRECIVFCFFIKFIFYVSLHACVLETPSTSFSDHKQQFPSL